MTQDPRFRNKTANTENIGAYLDWYADSLHQTLKAVDKKKFEAAFHILQEAHALGKHIWVAGNGGSAAIADHLCCDWTKGTHCSGKPALVTHSLVANNALLTAIANDFGYEQAFSKQVELLCAPQDVLVLISSSGNSPNILAAAEAAKAMGMKTIGFSGFSGGKLAQVADVNLYAAFDNYGLVEDTHQILMHVTAQFFTIWRERLGK